jgi:hypothetical protein
MMTDEAWRQSVRDALSAPADGSAASASEVASRAIVLGTQRIVARASNRIALVGLGMATLMALGAYRWAEGEASRTADATLLEEASWTP